MTRLGKGVADQNGGVGPSIRWGDVGIRRTLTCVKAKINARLQQREPTLAQLRVKGRLK
jgi:hypothetical protein